MPSNDPKPSPISKLSDLLGHLSPELEKGLYVFCFLCDKKLSEIEKYGAICIFREENGWSLILPLSHAKTHQLSHDGVFCKITLRVHSSLHAIGLTKAVSAALAERGVGANIVAAFHHDHIFVPQEHAEKAIEVLTQLQNNR